MAVLGGAVLLGSTFLSTPVTAQTVEELKAQISELSLRVDELQNQNVATPMIAPAQAVTAGEFPGSIKLPGTNTSFKVGGYVAAHLHYTTIQGLGDNSFFIGSIPAAGSAQDNSNGQTRILAKQTRFNIQTRTPSDFGQIRTHIEGDFFGAGGNENASNSSTFRLRHAYGTVGNFMAGQTWSNFMILGTLPDTIDFAGPVAIPFARQGQIKYTVPFEGGWRLEVSVENPQSRRIAGDPVGTGSFGAFPESNADQIPDFTAKVTWGGAWGFVSLAGLVGALDIDTVFTAPCAVCGPIDDMTLAWGVHAGGRVNTWGKDSAAAAVVYTDGSGRYVNPFGVYPSGYVDMRVPGSPDIETIDHLGGHASYEHWWADNLYSTATAAIATWDVPNAGTHPGVSFLGTGSTEIYVSGNLQWQPAAGVTMGVEYLWGRNSFVGLGAVANTAHRVQAMAKWSF